jgi:hypothetical protein
MIRTMVEFISTHGAKPYIVAAMGSHGKGTAEGQKALLAGLGVSEESIGAPIISSMEVVELDRLPNGLPVYFDRAALELDGILAFNRVKVHTAFKSDIESGLMKMLAVGLGNKEGASMVHSLGVTGLKDYTVDFAHRILKKAPIIAGVGVLENAYDETCLISAGPPNDIPKIDQSLLSKYKLLMPSLPMPALDILFVHEMGKDISGTGMDTNVVGGVVGFEPGECNSPDIKRIIVQDFSEGAEGNAMGIGLADLITRKLYEKIDFKATYTNAVTSTILERVKIPVVAETEKEAFEIARNTIWNLPGVEPLVAIIRNTLKLDELFVSNPVWKEIKALETIEAIGDWQSLSFDEYGNLTLRI